MFIAIDKITAVKMHGLIEKHWHEHVRRLEGELSSAANGEERLALEGQIEWMRETKIAVVVSEEQGEVAKFRNWGLDIQPHRRLAKEGFETADGERIDVDSAFKKDGHPFRVAIVCAMWLTGFDVKSLATLYLDKPLKAHTLMQAIARGEPGARRQEQRSHRRLLRHPEEPSQRPRHLRRAHGNGRRRARRILPRSPRRSCSTNWPSPSKRYARFSPQRRSGSRRSSKRTASSGTLPLPPPRRWSTRTTKHRKRFEIMARIVFRKFRACLTVKEVHVHRNAYDAINIVYKSLQADRDKTDISQIIRELHAVVGESISPARAGQIRESPVPYDISAIDFERLRQEFARSTTQNTHVQNLKGAIEKRLARMLAQNPLRTDFQQHYENLVADYNREKDRVTIEKTFEALLKLVAELDDEQARALREGLDEPTLALFDLLKKEELTPADIKRIKQVAVDLYASLREELARIRDWEQKHATRDLVKQTIFDFLYSDETGLPESYSEDEITTKSNLIFGHFLTQQQHGLALAAG